MAHVMMSNTVQLNTGIFLAESDHDILKCWDVMFALRPHLEREEFASRVKEMITEGYRLAYIETDGKAVAAVGFRYLNPSNCMVRA